MLTLYHGTTSVCACKVRIVFAEKGQGRRVTEDGLRKFGSAPADAPDRVARLLAAA